MAELYKTKFYKCLNRISQPHYEIRNEDCDTHGMAPMAKVSPDRRLMNDNGLEVANRIVAALNACQGIPTDVLYQISVAALISRALVEAKNEEPAPVEDLVNLLGINKVATLTSLSKATLYRYVSAGQFPKPVKLSDRRVAWREPDVIEWVESRKKKED